ncbi:glycine--tRNA ligase subunit beta [Peptoniphilus catoniae]|uniref:glycine--tRNA ligase subunit beta n=1 Tax=Peptoniphilus catoniae TaxID=1660341 RepID=UPI0010FD3AF7|nr:glycine--tRNA ligase subunit beta [Peptoniphilus catoniae]
MNRYLLEIGVEELPSRFIGRAIEDFSEKASQLFEANKIKYGNIKVYATPRRLSLIVDDIALKQQDIHEEVKGPAKKISFDEEGKPTKPLQGFMKSQGIDKDSIVFKEYKGVEYVYAEIFKKGDDTKTIIKENASDLIKSINFPKNMRWGGKNIRFARPIRWVVSLLNSEIVDFEFEGIPVSNITRGHRFLGSSKIFIDEVDNYEKLLEDNYVILDQEKRRDTIKYGSIRLAKTLGGEIEKDDALLEELTYIVEYPNPIIGNIKEKYLNLPKEVLVTPMKGHLRFIPIVNSKGDLLPNFITIRNGNSEHNDTVIEGNEKVLDARLEDAKFFYEEDTSKNLEDYVDALKGVMFQEKLGTMYDKSLRTQKLAVKIGEELEVAEKTIESVKRAAKLMKADLTTKTVQEFTELQGIMGSIYAKNSGEKDIVSQGIYEHYLPRFSGDNLPDSTVGSILALADKIDSICGLFAVGLIPTGSQDPFGLRRQAIGVINIIIKRGWKVSVNDLINSSLYLYANDMTLAFDYGKTKGQILEFFAARLRNILQERNIRYDIIDSIINSEDSVSEIVKKADELNEYFKEDRKDLVDALTRVHNLVKNKDEDVEFKEDLLKEDAEIELYKLQKISIENIIELNKEKKYSLALDEFSKLIGPINKYFENIMVLTDDKEIKNNRLSMLNEIDETAKDILDIEKIVTE